MVPAAALRPRAELPRERDALREILWIFPLVTQPPRKRFAFRGVNGGNLERIQNKFRHSKGADYSGSRPRRRKNPSGSIGRSDPYEPSRARPGGPGQRGGDGP